MKKSEGEERRRQLFTQLFNISEDLVPSCVCLTRIQKVKGVPQSVIPLCDKGAQHLHSISVCGIRPAWWWNCDPVVTEVHKNVNQLPVAQRVQLAIK